MELLYQLHNPGVATVAVFLILGSTVIGVAVCWLLEKGRKHRIQADLILELVKEGKSVEEIKLFLEVHNTPTPINYAWEAFKRVYAPCDKNFQQAIFAAQAMAKSSHSCDRNYQAVLLAVQRISEKDKKT